MRKVGILYDNISDNTGDVAIGMSLQKILQELNIAYDELIPGDFNPLDYDTIIVGGGHLLRPSPDFFYDDFRIPGRHILNAMGIVDNPEDLDYLNDYECLTVRSNGDKKKLEYLHKKVHVIPCTSMLLEDMPRLPCTLKKPCVGMHLFPFFSSRREKNAFIQWASCIPFTIYFLPITHYRRDDNLMQELSERLPNARLLPKLKAEEIFTIIGQFDAFISCSLHGAIFAYRHNVPFILFNANDKMQFFMEDRHLKHFLFDNFSSLTSAFETILKDRPDYSFLVAKDLKRLGRYKEALKITLSGSADHKGIDNQSQSWPARSDGTRQADGGLKRVSALQSRRKFLNRTTERFLPQGTRRRLYFSYGLMKVRIWITGGRNALKKMFSKK